MWVLIFIVATSNSFHAGSAAVAQEFTTEAQCRSAMSALSKSATARDNYVLTTGCFKK